MIKKLFLLWSILVWSHYTLWSQCAAPTGLTATTSLESCIADGSVVITAMTPAVATLPTGDFYEYRLTDASSNIIRNWQTSAEFLGLPAGTYRTQIRRYCASSSAYSTIYSPTTNRVVTTLLSSLSFATVPDLCAASSGQITVSSTNPSASSLSPGDYYEYQLTDATNNIIRPWQIGTVFASLNAGTYIIQVRKYCNAISGYSNTYTHTTNAIVYNSANSVNVSAINSYCSQNGQILVNSVSPTATSLPTGDFYEYRLTDVSSSIIRNWQLATEFLALAPGSYRVQVRRYCSSTAAYLPPFTPTTNYIINTGITSHTVSINNEFCLGSGGSLEITATTPTVATLRPSDYYEYQLVNASNAVVRPWQTANNFRGVPTGTYRLQQRAWCNNEAGYSSVYAPTNNRVINTTTAPVVSFAGSSVLRHETCFGNALIKVGTVLPNPNLLANNEYYEYRLVSAADTSIIIKTWQVSDTFQGGIADGSYKVQVRRICPGSISGSTTQTNNVVVNEAVVPANITSITINRTALCCDGRATVLATGNAPLQYAIVTSINAPDLPSSILKPKQLSNILDSLCEGTHFVRVWDACGGYATQQIVVAAYTTVPTFSTATGIYNYRRITCDSFVVNYRLEDIRRWGNHTDTSIIRSWIVWPDNSTDTVNFVNNTSNLVTAAFTSSFTMAKLDPLYNPALPFKANMSTWPKTVVFGYKDNCGNVYTFPQSINPGPLVPRFVFGNGCDSVDYSFYLYHNTPVSGGGQNVFGTFSTSTFVYLNENTKYSLDNGVTWHAAVSSGIKNASDSFKLARATSYTLKIAYCNDTITQMINVAALPNLASVVRIKPGTNSDCIATLDIGSVSTLYGDTIVVEMVNAVPALIPMPPPVRVPRLVGADVFTNLPMGTYTVRVSDSIGTECNRSLNQVITIAQTGLDLNFRETNVYACKSRSGFGIVVSSNSGAEGRPVTFEVLAQPLGSALPAIFTVPIITHTTFQYLYEPILSSVLPGFYSFRITDSSGTASSCPRTITRDITITNERLINNVISLSQHCNGALEINQFDSLYTLTSAATPVLSSNNGYWVAEVYNATNTLLWRSTGSAGAFVGNARFVVPQNIANAWPNADYRVRVFNNYDGTASRNDSCTVTETVWRKGTVTINPSGSIFLNGCSSDSASAVIVGVATGSHALPFSWSLYKGTTPNQDSLIRLPSYDNIFYGLSANRPYLISVSDTCGFGQNYVTSISNKIRVLANNTTNTQCPGEDVTFSVQNVPGAVYQWYKSGSAIVGATSHSLQLTNIQRATDSGYYHVTVELPDCDLLSNYYLLKVDCSVLPLTLLQFNAYKKGTTVELEWRTASESNTRGFNVESSSDGILWDKMAYVPTKAINGESKEVLTYKYIDTRMFQTDRRLYRLKQLDIDGQYEYSPIRTVWWNNSANREVSIYPNPTKTTVTITYLDGNEMIQLLDVTGKILYESTVDNTSVTIPMQQWLDGLYFISITNKEGYKTTHKIIKGN